MISTTPVKTAQPPTVIGVDSAPNEIFEDEERTREPVGENEDPIWEENRAIHYKDRRGIYRQSGLWT